MKWNWKQKLEFGSVQIQRTDRERGNITQKICPPKEVGEENKRAMHPANLWNTLQQPQLLLLEAVQSSPVESSSYQLDSRSWLRSQVDSSSNHHWPHLHGCTIACKSFSSSISFVFCCDALRRLLFCHKVSCWAPLKWHHKLESPPSCMIDISPLPTFTVAEVYSNEVDVLRYTT